MNELTLIVSMHSDILIEDDVDDDKIISITSSIFFSL